MAGGIELDAGDGYWALILGQKLEQIAGGVRVPGVFVELLVILSAGVTA